MLSENIGVEVAYFTSNVQQSFFSIHYSASSGFFWAEASSAPDSSERLLLEPATRHRPRWPEEALLGAKVGGPSTFRLFLPFGSNLL